MLRSFLPAFPLFCSFFFFVCIWYLRFVYVHDRAADRKKLHSVKPIRRIACSSPPGGENAKVFSGPNVRISEPGTDYSLEHTGSSRNVKIYILYMWNNIRNETNVKIHSQLQENNRNFEFSGLMFVIWTVKNLLHDSILLKMWPYVVLHKNNPLHQQRKFILGLLVNF